MKMYEVDLSSYEECEHDITDADRLFAERLGIDEKAAHMLGDIRFHSLLDSMN